MKSILNFLFGARSTGEVKALVQVDPPPPLPKKKDIDVTIDKKKKIQSILNVFETGKIDGDYSNVSIFNDGPNEIRQITFGRSQTTQHSHFKELIDNYIDANGQFSKDLLPYKGRGKDFSLVHDKHFISLLKKTGDDPVMRKVQDELFDKRYWEPAMKWARDNGFEKNVSFLVIFDSFIHSGGILLFLRNRFSEKTPKNGGNEIEWLRVYLKTRHNWLKTHSRPILRKTIYRTSAMINHLESGDYDLDKRFFANGIWIP